MRRTKRFAGFALAACMGVSLLVNVPVGTVSAEFRSDFSQAGVNQTLHRIELEVAVPVTLILPGGQTELTVETGLLVAETVIVGAVPDTYLTLNGAA